MLPLRHFLAFLALAATGIAADSGADVRALDAQLKLIGKHAMNYPPRFDSAEQRADVEARLRTLIGQLDAAATEHPDDATWLLRDALANAMGHNLDFPGASKHCDEVYAHLLELQPANAQVHFNYGVFLAGSAHQQRAIPLLEQAIVLGEPRANYSLAIAYLTLNKPGPATGYLRAYLKQFPDDRHAQKLLTALESEDLKIQLIDGPPPAPSPADATP